MKLFRTEEEKLEKLYKKELNIAITWGCPKIISYEKWKQQKLWKKNIEPGIFFKFLKFLFPLKPKSINSDLAIFTDASYLIDEKLGSAGFIVFHKEKEIFRNITGYNKIDEIDINNLELRAICLALRWKKENFPDKTLTIYSDSCCSINRINNFTCSGIKKKDLELLKKESYSLEYVKAHQKDNSFYTKSNNLIDSLVRNHARKMKKRKYRKKTQ